MGLAAYVRYELLRWFYCVEATNDMFWGGGSSSVLNVGSEKL